MPKNQPFSHRSVASLVFLFLLIFTGYSQDLPTDQAIIDQGQTLFQQNCAPCHRVDSKLIGPALAGVYDRRDLEWIISFIQNSQRVIASGDQYAVDLYDEYNQVVMPAFDFYDEAQITSIIAYIKAEAEKPKEEIVDEAAGGTDAAASDESSKYLNAILIGLLVVLVLILIVLALIVSLLKRYLTERKELDAADQEVVVSPIKPENIIRHKAFIGAVVFIFTAIVVKSVIDGLFSIGIQQGYAPAQPIAFSHKIHAGQFEIDCNYCHTGVMKSKNANIPSPNICMNCHSEILKDSPEIQKIYAAVENEAPIEWVRVHNLPDLAYFNHAQHVNIGGVECQTCHGPIEEMDVVRQFAPLTMGWCIDCHRTTELNTRDNSYYDKLVELHKEKSKEPMKVEDIGGLECAKCHY